MNQKILITSALPYANGPLHFGHIAGAYLPGDCYARFERLKGNRVLYVCGSDEYGVAITMSAEMAGRTPKEHVDIFHALNESMFQKLNFSFDHYSRTSWEGHIAPVHEFFNDLVANEYIEERTTEQLYSVKEDRFLADRYVIGTCPSCGFENARGDECPKCSSSYEATDLINPRSRMTNSPLTLKQTKHWFILLEKFKDQLQEWLESKNWKPNVMNFVRGYIQELRPRAITRDAKWGIKVPLKDSDGKVIYVWFDAPIGYISATKEWALKQGDPEKWKEFWCDPRTKLVQFIGKDNIPFHGVIFPAMIMGQKQPYKLVDDLPANEFLNLEGKQFSKTEGWFIDMQDFFTRYHTDQIRYTIAANAPETSDSEFTWKDFQNRCNSELLGKYGNLVNRVLVFAKNHTDGKVPPKHELSEVDEKFLDAVKQIAMQAEGCYSTYQLRKASKSMMELAQLGNVYFDRKRPWLDAQEKEQKSRLETTIYCCLECLKTLALISLPIIPETAGKTWDYLGYHEPLSGQLWDNVIKTPIESGQSLRSPKILFQRVSDEQIEVEIEKLFHMSSEAKKTKPEKGMPLKPPIAIDDVRKLDLRVGEIKFVEPLPKSKHLYLLTVDIGIEERKIISGIRKSYTQEQLIGQKVVVIANLKPAEIHGCESQGMILAGSDESNFELPSIEKLPNGSAIF